MSVQVFWQSRSTVRRYSRRRTFHWRFCYGFDISTHRLTLLRLNKYATANITLYAVAHTCRRVPSSTTNNQYQSNKYYQQAEELKQLINPIDLSCFDRAQLFYYTVLWVQHSGLLYCFLLLLLADKKRFPLVEDYTRFNSVM